MGGDQGRVRPACRLRIDCLVRDRQQAPYLHYRNHKMRREAMVPIDEQLAAMIETQQRRVLARYPKASVLFPRSTGNPDGQRSLPTSTFDLQLKQWLIVCHVTDELGEPAQVTAHRFRHSYASRLINSEVSQEVVRRLLDHTSHTMTAQSGWPTPPSAGRGNAPRRSIFGVSRSSFPRPIHSVTRHG